MIATTHMMKTSMVEIPYIVAVKNLTHNMWPLNFNASAALDF